MHAIGYLIEPPENYGTGPMYVRTESPLVRQAIHGGWIVTPVYDMPALTREAGERQNVAYRLARAVMQDIHGTCERRLIDRAAAVLVEEMDEIDRGDSL